MSALERRVSRLERESGKSGPSIGDRLDAAIKRWQEDPEGAEREAVASRRAHIDEVETAHREGRRVSALSERLYRAFLRIAEYDEQRDAPTPSPRC